MDITALKAIPLLATLSEEELIRLLFSTKHALHRYAKGTFIRLRGDEVDSLIILAEGTIKGIMDNESGREVTVESHEAPAVLASAFVFATSHELPVNLEAERDCEMFFVPRDVLLETMLSNRRFLEEYLRTISDRGVFLSGRLREFAVTDLKNRILEYYREHGEIGNQTELAQRLGVARPSLTRALTELAKEGKVKKE